MRRLIRWAAVCGGLWFLAVSGPALAHNIWLVPDNHFPQVGDTVQIKVGFGHDYPANRVDQPVKEGMIGEALAVIPGGGQVALEKTAVDTYQLKIDRPGPYLLVASMPPGLFSRTPEGMKRGGRKDFPEVKSCMEARMVANTFVFAGGQGQGMIQSDQSLQLKPLADMAGLKKGGVLPIQVLFDGQPLAGAKIKATYAGYQPPADAKPQEGHGAPMALETSADAEGKAELRLEVAGHWLVILNHSTPYQPAEVCDKRMYMSSYAIEVK
jgi:uncharacterized GH25 family protein